jgi:hypothetical protein
MLLSPSIANPLKGIRNIRLPDPLVISTFTYEDEEQERLDKQ